MNKEQQSSTLVMTLAIIAATMLVELNIQLLVRICLSDRIIYF